MSCDQVLFKVEYAKAAYRCRQCRGAITWNELCIATAVEAEAAPSVKSKQRYHFDCFFVENHPTSPADIGDFFSLSCQDRERIEEKITEANQANYWIRKTRNAEIKCSLCGELISRGSPSFGSGSQRNRTRYHVECFTEHVGNFLWLRSSEYLTGCCDLSREQREALNQMFDARAGKLKRPADGETKQPVSRMIKVDPETALKEQSDRLSKLREDLGSKMTEEELETVLKHNQLEVPVEKSCQVERLADALVFGVSAACPECKRGTPEFEDGVYKCKSALSAYTWCDYISTNGPPRSKLQIPENFLQRFPFLQVDVEQRIPTKRPERLSMAVDTREAWKTLRYVGGTHTVVDSSKKLKLWEGCLMRSSTTESVIVDPLCRSSYLFSEAATKHSISQNGKEVCSCVLAKTDLSRGINSHCRLQLLIYAEFFVVFLASNESRNKLDPWQTSTILHESPDEAREHFETLFFDLTGNRWGARMKFVKMPDKFDLIKTAFLQEESLRLSGEEVSYAPLTWFQSTFPDQGLDSYDFELPPAVQRLLGDIAKSTRQKIDIKEMPLGVVTLDQLIRAREILAELLTLMQSDEASQLQLLDASNKFFTVIPQSFDADSPLPLLDNPEAVEEKQRMLNLWIANLFSKKMPQMYLIQSLKTGIEVLPKDSTAFRVIKNCCENTPAGDDSIYQLEVVDVFSIERRGEVERFAPFKNFPNRKLLWHGSRRDNFESILSNGLRVGYPHNMFGAALYFADSVKKAYRYCGYESESGFLLLCEVALGNMFEVTKDIVKQLPEGMDSVKGVGKNQLYHHEELDGCQLAFGPMRDSGVEDATLKFDEYAIYDPAQAQIRYLVEVRRVPENRRFF